MEQPSVDAVIRHFPGLALRHPTVLGRLVDGRPITLEDVRVNLRQVNLETPEDATIDLDAQRVYLGAHMGEPPRTFARAELQLEFLLDFLGRDAIQEDIVLDAGRWVGVRLEEVQVDPTHVALPGGSMQLGAAFRTSGDRWRERGIARAAKANLELDASLSPLAWVASYVVPLSELLTLVTGKPSAIDEVSLSAGDGDVAQTGVEFLWQRDAPEPSERSLLPVELMFTAAETPIPLDELVARWLRASAELRPILDLFFATRGHRPLFEEHRLLNLTQALEAYHRIRVGGQPIDPMLHTGRVDRALAALAPTDRKWAKRPLTRANQFTLAERISALVSAHQWLLGDVVPSTARQFGEHVATTRNFHTHWDQLRSSGAARGFELWPLNERLSVLIEACLLAEIGCPEDAVAEALRRASGSYRALKLNGM